MERDGHTGLRELSSGNFKVFPVVDGSSVDACGEIGEVDAGEHRGDSRFVRLERLLLLEGTPF
jgi:hypothetical protein